MFSQKAQNTQKKRRAVSKIGDRPSFIYISSINLFHHTLKRSAAGEKGQQP